MNLSKNFTLDELVRSQTATRLGIPNTPTPEHLANMRALCERVLQPIRDSLGPVNISSGYRSPELNRRIGGSTTSQHSLGQAADFSVTGMTPLQVCQWIEKSSIPFDQLIWEGTWVHISFGPRNRREVLTARFPNGKAVYSKGLPK